jgi:hypothetical protein
MATEPLRFDLALDLGQGASPEELDDAARRLRLELEEAGVAEVELARGGPAPEGAKAGDSLRIGALTLGVLPSALGGVLAVVRDWASRRPGRTLQFEYSSGPQRIRLEYDPEKTDINQLLATLVQASAAVASADLRPGVGGDAVMGNKTTRIQAGGDAIGRDKVTTINVAPGSTLIVNDPALGALKPAAPPITPD